VKLVVYVNGRKVIEVTAKDIYVVVDEGGGPVRVELNNKAEESYAKAPEPAAEPVGAGGEQAPAAPEEERGPREEEIEEELGEAAVSAPKTEEPPRPEPERSGDIINELESEFKAVEKEAREMKDAFEGGAESGGEEDEREAKARDIFYQLMEM